MDLTEGDIRKKIIIFSFPIIISDLLQTIQSLFDSFWLGKFIGYTGIAAVSTSMPVIFFLFSFFIGFAVATNILIGQSFGADRKDLLTKVISNSFVLMMICGIFLSLIGVVFSDIILMMISVPENIFTDAKIYFVIYLLGIPLVASYNWLAGITRGLGNSNISLMMVIVFSLLHIVLSPILISVFIGLSFSGLVGAGLSLVFSQAITFFIFFFYVKKKYSNIFKGFSFSLNWDVILKTFKLGLPASVQMLVISFGQIVLISLINSFGDSVLGGYGVGIRLENFVFLPALSLGMAMTTFASQNMGAGKEDRVREGLKFSLLISSGIALLVFAILNIFLSPIGRLFLGDASEALKHFEEYIRITSLAYLFIGLVFPIQGVIRGAGDTFGVMVIKMVSMILIRIPLAYILAIGVLSRNVVGVWVAMSFTFLLEFIVTYLYYKKGIWKKKVLIRKSINLNSVEASEKV